MNAIFYPAIFHPEESGYSVEIPDIEGCFTQGDTMDEAVRMAQDAIGLMLEDCKVCPEPSVPSALHVDPEDFVVMVPFDMEEYEKRYRPVKKTLSIPGCRRIGTHQLFRRPSGCAERETPSGVSISTTTAAQQLTAMVMPGGWLYIQKNTSTFAVWNPVICRGVA